MLAQDDAAREAGLLFDAERSRQQTGLISRKFPDASLDDAYAIQKAFVDRKIAAGERVVGWKIGLTSRAMQEALAIDVPDSGVLFDTMVFEDGATVPKGRFIQPRIEAEIAFVMRKPLSGRHVTIFDVIDATEFVTPALEILDTRIVRADPETGRRRTVIDTIADNAANAGVIMGGRMIDPRTTDLRWMGAIVYRDATVEETGLGAGVLSHPAYGIVWLVRRLAEYGEALEAGQIVLAGSFIRPVEAPGGSTIIADYGPYGLLTCHFQ